MLKTQLHTAVPFRCEELNAVRISGVDHFDANKIFDCGQSFRFDRVTASIHEAEFAGIAHGKYISIACDKRDILIYNTDPEEYDRIWKAFLGLDRNYGEINESIRVLSDSKVLEDAVQKADGIRILRQDAWETICSFIISQNNNIPRIKKLITALCLACGDKLDTSAMTGHIADLHLSTEGHFFTFPSPERVLDLGISGLTDLKMGFRAKYIYDAARKIADGEIDFDYLEEADLADGISHLCRVKGIGPKVACCALLFGFGKLDAFPVDVWIKKAIQKYFSADFTPSMLGQYAGVAQQYLFYYERYLKQ